MTKTALRCPRDGANLEPTRYEGEIEIDLCPTCRGSWLDKGELEAIQENDERDPGPPPASSGGHQKSPEERAKIACPKCSGEMETHEHGYASQVLVDTCIAGCGVWLDGGELQALERFYEQNRSNETLPLHWRVWASLVSKLKR